MPAFRDMEPGENLDNFHQRCVVPTPQATSSHNGEIESVVGFLRLEFRNAPLTVARVLMSGSLGKGTAVRDSADIDLVVALNGLHSISDLKRARPHLLTRLHRAVLNYPRWKGRVQLRDETNYSRCYLVNGLKVNILPALDLFPYVMTGMLTDKEKVYSQMASYPEGKWRAAQEFSASLAPLQIDFVKSQGEGVKRVIRLLKFWKKEKDVDIRSSTLELLTIHTVQTYGWRGTEDLFRKVLIRLEDCRSIEVIFDTNYDSGTYISHHKVPYVIDPANPFMDTLHGADYNKISRAARNMLNRL